MKFSIYNGSTLQFEEVQKTRTDAYGLVNLMIGSVSTASFNSLVWDSSQKTLQVQVSFNQGGSYLKVSEQKLTYSPYTLFAETAGKLGGILAISGGGTGATTITGMKTSFGLDNLDNTSDLNKPISTLTQTALNLKVNTSLVAAVNGVASLGADGKVPLIQLPSFSITSVSVVNSSANMLALTGLTVGSVAVRTDNATNYILTALPASTLANWVSFSPASVNVQSVNGATGAVALTGSANRILVTGNVFDIASTYAGQSSITTLGTIGTGIWNGTTIAINKGGTGATTANDGFNALAPAQSGHTGKFLTTNGTNTSWASISSAGGWSTTGNSGTVDGTHFFGTTDAQPLNVQVGGIVSGRFDVNAVSGQSTLGYGAGYSLVRNLTNSYGTKNTGFGYQSFYNTTFGNENTAMGYQALLTNVAGASSTAIGYQAMSNANSTLNGSIPLITYNTAVGYQSLQGSATASANTGYNNTSVGYQSLKNTTSGYGNSGYGVSALVSLTTGAYNTGVGYQALMNSTTSNYNVGIGMYALRSISTGGNNVGIGYYTMSSNSTGSNNVAIGHAANIGEGVSNGIAIGQGSSNSTSNTIVLGNTSITKVSTSGTLYTSNTTNATSVSTGSLIANGGAGIAKDVYVGGSLNTAGTSSTVGRASFSGGITATSINVNTIDNVVVVNASSLAATSISGITNITNATASSSTTTGALTVSGGVGIVGSTYIGGATTMLPTQDAQWVSNELAKRFKVPLWSFSLSATDANRWALRLARMVTGRSKVLAFSYGYHGTVDETFVVNGPNGETLLRPGNVGAPGNINDTTRVAEFNDLDSVEKALANGDVAVIITEPALTNIGIVLPEPRFLEGLRELATKYGSLLLIDETHTFSAGIGGMTKANNLNPDIVTIGKSIGGGIPSGAYGITKELADKATKQTGADLVDVGGVGGTLSGNALSIAAMRAI